MPRPHCPRRCHDTPAHTYFKPRGVPVAELAEVRLGVDELESLRLADQKGLYQEEAARRMNVSRATFGRIVTEARRKVAEALVRGQALRIEGGVVETAPPGRLSRGGRRRLRNRGLRGRGPLQ